MLFFLSNIVGGVKLVLNFFQLIGPAAQNAPHVGVQNSALEGLKVGNTGLDHGFFDLVTA